jgi:hypothetical protein
MRRVLLVAVALLLAMQLVPVARTGRPGAVDRLDAPAQVAEALRLACYDCHSQATVWPWYSRIAPVSWLVAHDVVEGREHLDFSAWQTLGPRRRAKLLGQIAKDVEEGEMPPALYRFAHPEARLDEATRHAMVAWARSAQEALQRTIPASR